MVAGFRKILFLAFILLLQTTHELNQCEFIYSFSDPYWRQEMGKRIDYDESTDKYYAVRRQSGILF